MSTKQRADAPRTPPVIAFVGCFQDGKSTLINCLLEEECAEVGDGHATTAKPTLYEYGPQKSRTQRRIGHVEMEVVSLPNKRLMLARLLDTPGRNSTHLDHDNHTNAVLESGIPTFVVLVIPKASPLRKDHLELLLLAQHACLPTAVVMNSRDWKDQQGGWSKSLDNVRRSLEAEGHIKHAPLFRIGSLGPVMPCVAAWLYPTNRFCRAAELFRKGATHDEEHDEEWQRMKSGIRELRRFVFGVHDSAMFPNILSVNTICQLGSVRDNRIELSSQ